MSFQWDCPYCGRSQIVGDENHRSDSKNLFIGSTKYGHLELSHSAVRCLNADCNEPTVVVELSYGVRDIQQKFTAEGSLAKVRMVPRSSARPQPEYIPQPIRDDYVEACLIRDDSPKASATLSRRALQGMLRDFCGVNEKTLFAEITALETLIEKDAAPKGVETETIAAIHAVRKIGNIGAHMEADINVIVDVDPGEAQALINLLELLFEDWYVARESRRQRLQQILQIEGVKEAAKGAPPKGIAAPSAD